MGSRGQAYPAVHFHPCGCGSGTGISRRPLLSSLERAVQRASSTARLESSEEWTRATEESKLRLQQWGYRFLVRSIMPVHTGNVESQPEKKKSDPAGEQPTRRREMEQAKEHTLKKIQISLLFRFPLLHQQREQLLTNLPYVHRDGQTETGLRRRRSPPASWPRAHPPRRSVRGATRWRSGTWRRGRTPSAPSAPAAPGPSPPSSPPRTASAAPHPAPAPGPPGSRPSPTTPAAAPTTWLPPPTPRKRGPPRCPRRRGARPWTPPGGRGTRRRMLRTVPSPLDWI
jgi:hypothetical protein